MLKKLLWNQKLQRLTMIPRLFVHLIIFAVVFFPVRMLNRLVRTPLLSALLNIDQTKALELLNNIEYRSGSTIFNSLAITSELLVLLIGLAIIVRFVDRRRFSDFWGKMNKQWWHDLAIGLLIGGLLQLIIFLIAWTNGWIEISGFFEKGTDGAPFTVAFLSMLIFFVFAAFNEELQFRGYPIRTLTEGLSRLGTFWSIFLSIAITSILFGIAHATNPNINLIIKIGIIFGGVWMALGYTLTGSLALSTGIHFAWNFVQFFFGFPVSGLDFGAGVISTEQHTYNAWIGTQFGPESGYLSMIAMILGIIAVLAYTKHRNRSIRPKEDLTRPNLRKK